jgi:hypothetical protein
LKPNLKENDDFTLVDENIWKYVSEHYGVKNDIISIKNDSISESESCDESDDSESEDMKPLLINKSSKTKTIIKTTKGNSKAPKLSINDSESDSD